MPPSLRVESQLTPEDAAAWLAKAQPVQGPPGGQLVWTDDMSIRLPPGRVVAEVVDFVLQATLRGVTDDEIELALAREFALNAGDAHIARDRTFGGLVRAASRNPLNRPAPDKDPIAFESFQRVEADRSLIARIYPEYA